MKLIKILSSLCFYFHEFSYDGVVFYDDVAGDDDDGDDGDDDDGDVTYDVMIPCDLIVNVL